MDTAVLNCAFMLSLQGTLFEGLDKHNQVALPAMMFLFNALMSAGGKTSEVN